MNNNTNDAVTQINQINNEMQDLKDSVNGNLDINGDYASYYKRQINQISSNVNEINDMMKVASNVEQKINLVLQLKSEIEDNIKKIGELDEKINLIKNVEGQQQEVENIQIQINLLNNININKKEQYDTVIKEIKDIISQN